MRTGTLHYALLTVVIALVSWGCAGSAPVEPPRSHHIARRQLPPEPVYNRLRWVQVPGTVPAAGRTFSPDRPRVLPVVELSLQGATLDEAASVLASSARYSSYCASTIAKDQISFQALGTIDELAQKIADQAGIRAVVDHDNRQVRFFAIQLDTPRFYEEGKGFDEHQSNN